MKKFYSYVICVFFVLMLIVCAKEIDLKKIEGGIQTYYEKSDGTWQCNGYDYKYRLEISGRLPQAEVNSTYVYLSNIEEISFEEAWKASGLSSSSEDYFPVEDAVIVDIKTE